MSMSRNTRLGALSLLWIAVSVGAWILVPAALGSCRTSRPDPYLEPSDRDEEELQRLARAGAGLPRFYALGDAARVRLKQGDLEQANALAEELVQRAEAHHGNWNYGNAIHDAHVVLGYLALAQDEVDDATEHLLAAGRTPGSPQLSTFGPNLSLARALLQRGVREAVLEYLELCRRFWRGKGELLDKWKSAIEADRTPDFGFYIHNGT